MREHPKRILHLIDTTGPGGAETVYVSLADYTRANRAASLAVIRGDGWVKSQLEAAGIVTRVVDCKGSFNVRFLSDLVRIIREEEIDLIQAHLLGSNVYACLAGMVTRTPVICTFHGNVDVAADERLAWMKFALIRLGARQVIAVSEQLKQSIANYISDSKLSVIYNGVDLDAFQGARSYRPLEGKTIRIGALGNIRPAKDYFTAVNTIRCLKDRGYDVRLEIAGGGKGKLLSDLEDAIERLDLRDDVELLGFVADVPGFLQSLDVFMLSSSTEGHPLALIQAMAASLPIVATRCGVEEILSDEHDSLLVEPGAPKALADAVQRLIKDESLRPVLGRRARKKACSKYSLEAMHKGYWNAYCSSTT